MDSLRHAHQVRAVSSAAVAILSLSLSFAAHPALAYEGYGYQTVGGQGGSTCHVTNLASNGSGSLFDCVTNRSGPRIVVFDVAGTIVLADTLYIDSYTTIDGTTASSPGITIRPSNASTSAFVIESTHDVIIRGLRLVGYNPAGGVEDAADLVALDGTEGGEVYNVVIDHLSLSGADDGALDMTGNVHDVTASWCLLYSNGKDSLIKYDTRQRISIHHNVYAHNGERNPQVKGDMRTLDFRNNIIYDWTLTPDGYGLRLWSAPSSADSPGVPSINVIGNAFIAKNTGDGCGIDLIEDSTPVQRWVADNFASPSPLCMSSNLSTPLSIPAAAQVTTSPSSELAAVVLPTVGLIPHNSTEQALLDQIAARLPASSTLTLTVTKAGAGSGTITSSPAGISCGATCSASFPSGAVVTLSASAASGSVFAGWSGACTGTGACQVTMDAAKSVTATFNLNPVTYTLTVAKAGTGTGTVTSSPAGVSCGADCSEAYTSGTVVTLSQAATAGSSFAGWSGACTGTGSCQVTMDAARSVTATFNLNPVTYTLTVAKAGTGTGTVTSSPAGVSCGADCSEAYTSGTVVTLSQAATAGSSFAGWSGACTGTGSCQVTMDAARSVTATFNLNPVTYTLTVAKAGTGTGTVTSSPAGVSCGADCSEAYTSGTVVTLSQAATAGSSFAGWSGACTGTGSCQVTMDAARSVTATFNLNPVTYTLTVAKAGTGTGTVTSSPAGVSCGADCSEAYTSGTVVTLSQAATAGSSFAGWSGACTGTGACQVTMDAAQSVTATFNLNPVTYTLTVAKAGTGTGTVTSSPAGVSCGADCSEAYTSGTVVALTAAAASGSSFSGWSGACTGTGSCQVTMSAAQSVTATFTMIPITYTLSVTKSGDGTGTITSSPGGISCGADCSEAYGSGTVVTLTATPASGSVFTGWSGACTGTGSCQLTMNAVKSVNAAFAQSMYNLTVTKAGDGSGTVTSSPPGIDCGSDCAEPYNRGTVVTLTAAAATGSTFAGWSGACSGAGSCQITMDASKSAVATFSIVGGPTFPPGDFNEDGKPDLLWHNQVTGELKVWLLDNGTMTADPPLTPDRLADTKWRVRGLADLNGDGHGDLLWQNQQTGDLRAWLMNGTTLVSGVDLTPKSFGGFAWQIRGLADFNGDGTADILWHHQKSGTLYVWIMNGTTAVSGAYLTPGSNADTGWQINGLGDFNGDGTADILWRHKRTGDLHVWFMKGTKAAGASYLVPTRFADARWRVARLADLNGDGKVDILWRNQATGDLLVWYMNGITRVSRSPLVPSQLADPDWTVAPR